MILILNAYCCCGSTVLVESNTTNFLSNDILGEFLTDDDLEFPMHSYISRMLAGSPYDQLNPRKPAPPCGLEHDGRYCTDPNCKIRDSVPSQGLVKLVKGQCAPAPKPESTPCFLARFPFSCAPFFILLLLFFFNLLKIYNMLYFISN